MSKINIDIRGRDIIVRYKPNLYKTKILRPMRMQYNQQEDYWHAELRDLNHLISLIKTEGVLMQLSLACQDYLSFNEDGYSETELESERIAWKNHPSYLESPPSFFSLGDIGLLRPLYPFQLAGVYYATSIAGGRCILGDQPGLGKTIQSICIAAFYKRDFPVFIAAPVSLLYNWKKEFLLTLDWLEEDDIHIIDDASKSKPRGLITIGSYYQLYENESAIAEYLNTRGILIIDEAQSVRNLDSLRGGAAGRLAILAKRYLPISGTPILHRSRDIFALLYGIDPVLWNSQKEFTDYYSEGYVQEIKGKEVYNSSGASHLPELMSKVRESSMVRRLKKHVLPQLGEKRRHSIYLNATNGDAELDAFSEDLTLYVKNAIASGLDSLDKIGDFVKRSLAENGSISVFDGYEKAGLSKLTEVNRFIQDRWDVNPDEKILLFAHNKSVLDGIQRSFEKLKPNKDLIRVDGSLSPIKRFQCQEQFQSDENCVLALLSIEAAYAGFTFTKSNTVIVAQQPMSPEIANQLEDRAHRIGQEGIVDVIYLQGNNRFDSYLWKMNENKSSVSQYALDGARGSSFKRTSSVMDNKDMVVNMCREVIEELGVVL